MQEKEASKGFPLPETWEEYRVLAKSHSKASLGKTDVLPKRSGSSSSRKKVASGASAKPHAGGNQGKSTDSASSSNASTSEVQKTSERPKRACRLKRKHGKLV